MRRAVVIGLVSVLVVGGAIAALGTGRSASGQRYRIVFDSAFGLTKGADFKVGGVAVGSITDLDVDRRSARALVTVQATSDGGAFAGLRRSARCTINPQSLIGEYFVDCQPGTRGPLLRSGATIPVRRTTSPIPPDLVLDIARRPVAQRFSIILSQLGVGFAARGGDVNQTIRRALPALQTTNQVLAILARKRRTIADLARDGGRTLAVLGRRRRDVTDFVSAAADAASAAADRRTAIAETFRRFPGFLDQLTPTMRDLGTASRQFTPALRDLRVAAPTVTSLLDTLRPFAKASRPAITTLGTASRSGRTAAGAARPLVGRLRALGDAAPEPAKNLRIILDHLDDRGYAAEKDTDAPGGLGYTGLEAPLQYVFDQSLALNAFDQRGYALRINLSAGECSAYTTAADAKANPAKYARCNQDLGPDQPGITTADPSPAAPRAVATTSPKRLRRTGPTAAGSDLLDFLLEPLMRRRTTSAVFANPVLVGAVTVLAVVVAVFLAYNANQGLPFVPTYELKANVPNGAQLVAGNEVREGGHRIGTVTRIVPVKRANGTTGAQLRLQLDAEAGPVPADSTIRIRPRSALGLKYVELQRGSSRDTFDEGATIHAGRAAIAPDLQRFFDVFDEPTRRNVARNATAFGAAFAGRGLSLNRAFASLPRFLEATTPVMLALADPHAHLGRFFSELEDAAGVSAPLAGTMADGFRDGGRTFAALARDPDALRATIAGTPPTLRVGTSALRRTRPFLRSLAAVSGDLRLAAGELRRSAPPVRAALAAGVRPLRQTPALNARLGGTFAALTDLARSPGAETGVDGLTETMTTLRPLTRFIGPYITVCNYWNTSFTYLSDHITDQVQGGQVQRIRAKLVSPASPQGGLSSFGATHPVQGLHAQAYGAAIDGAGNADCESGQRGYPDHLASGIDPARQLVGDPVTPGSQGTTYTGRARVPAGETYSAVAEGLPGIDPGTLRP